MDLRIRGKQVPAGTVTVSGAKNSATRLLAAALLTEEPVRIRNFPTELVDARAKVAFISSLGGEVEIDETGSSIEVRARELAYDHIDNYDLAIRTTYLLAAGTLARDGEARVPYPGGCKIGSRGYDLHIMVWRSLGCEVEETSNFIHVRGRLKGGTINFPISTVGGTENALLCGAVATGTTEVHNAYVTPEVHDLIVLLRQMGAMIEISGNSMIRIIGRSGLLRGASHKVMPDRVEALTWIALGAFSGGEVLVRGVPFADLDVPLLHLRDMGIDFFRNSTSVMVNQDSIGNAGLQPFEVACGTHPGVISDMQPFYTILAMRASGRSRIFDYRYPERVAYAHELDKFNPGTISAENGRITVDGGARLSAAEVRSTDLRGSMALVMAGLVAEGETIIRDVGMAMRGYNNLVAKLQKLGLAVELS